jgi:hypothetical protein
MHQPEPLADPDELPQRSDEFEYRSLRVDPSSKSTFASWAAENRENHRDP